MPTFVQLRVTNLCNLRCKMCGQWGDTGVFREQKGDGATDGEAERARIRELIGLRRQLALGDYVRLLDELAPAPADRQPLRRRAVPLPRHPAPRARDQGAAAWWPPSSPTAGTWSATRASSWKRGWTRSRSPSTARRTCTTASAAASRASRERRPASGPSRTGGATLGRGAARADGHPARHRAQRARRARGPGRPARAAARPRQRRAALVRAAEGAGAEYERVMRGDLRRGGDLLARLRVRLAGRRRRARASCRASSRSWVRRAAGGSSTCTAAGPGSRSFPRAPPRRARLLRASPTRTFGHDLCPVAWYFAQVEPDGDVCFCGDFPDYVIGNVRRELVHVRSGRASRRAAFREKLAREPLPICARCCGSYVYGKWPRPARRSGRVGGRGPLGGTCRPGPSLLFANRVDRSSFLRTRSAIPPARGGSLRTRSVAARPGSPPAATQCSIVSQ